MLRLFHNAAQVVTCAGPARARRGGELSDAAIRTDCAVVIDGATITAVGDREEMRRRFPGAEPVDCARGVLTPGLVDSHTHAIFGKPRHDEQELRASGMDYMAIAAKGGGIHASPA